MDGCTKVSDQQGDEEASADSYVKDHHVGKLGDVARRVKMPLASMETARK